MAVARALITRGDVHVVQLNPTLGSEIRKTRPCLVISPDELNQHLHTVIVAPMTTGGHAYPWRIACRFQNRSGFVALDQLRTVDGQRLVKRLGRPITRDDDRRLGNIAGNVCRIATEQANPQMEPTRLIVWAITAWRRAG